MKKCNQPAVRQARIKRIEITGENSLYQSHLCSIKIMMKIIAKYFIVVVFVSSAFLKLLDFRATVDLFVNLLGMNYTITKIFLALLILTEFAMSYAIAVDYLKFNIAYLLILGLLMVFLFVNIFFALTGYANCGCFGAEIVSSPVLSIVKNVLLISAVVYLRHSFATLRLCERKEA